MNNQFIPLESVRVARPCRADWNAMQGDDTVRHCCTCDKNVYNLSSLSREQAEALVQEKEGKLCVRYYQRADGTMLTDDCPIGIKIARRPFRWLAAGFAALLASGASVFAGQEEPSTRAANLNGSQPLQTIINWLMPTPQVMQGGPPAVIMGDMAPCPVPTPLPAPSEDED